MRLMVGLYARQLFFRFFFIKKMKRQACAKNDVAFIFFKLLVKKLLLWTDENLLCRVFIRHALFILLRRIIMVPQNNNIKRLAGPITCVQFLFCIYTNNTFYLVLHHTQQINTQRL